MNRRVNERVQISNLQPSNEAMLIKFRNMKRFCRFIFVILILIIIRTVIICLIVTLMF